MKRTVLALCILFAVALRGASAAAPEKPVPLPTVKTPTVKSPKTEPAVLSGKVVETMNAGGYTYICLEKAGRKTWIAVPEMKVTVGKEMAFQPGQVMTNFSSKTLNRTFESIIFSSGPAAAGAAGGSLPTGHPTVPGGASGTTGSTAQSSKDLDVKVEKATGPNAYTVAEVYAKRIELNKKTVAVRGKVVKVSRGIMDRNWIHLQDGSGDQQKGTHNLVVTTKDTAEVGDVITASGTMSKDRDFGGGYLYKIIVEDAKIVK